MKDADDFQTPILRIVVEKGMPEAPVAGATAIGVRRSDG